jgi:RecA-family ATPase
MKMEPFNPADLDYFPPGEPWRKGAAASQKFRRIINPAEWEGLPVPPREWIVPGYIPHKTVTLLSGDGSVGKSLLALQLAAGRALAREWIGLMPEPGRTLILSAEDDADEMHRRLEDIRKFYGARMTDLAGMQLVDLVGEDSILGALVKGQIEPTPMYHALDEYLTEWAPILTALDVLADMFGGDENSRVQSRQFIGLLKKLARKHDCAFLLLAHPSLTGMNTGTGTSGSTGWSNAVRSRLYLQTAKASDGSEPNPNLRTLQGMKSNYGVPGGKIDLEWKNGLFVPVHGAIGLDKMAADAKADDTFLTILKRFNAQDRNAADRKGTSYAPALFAEEPDNQNFGKKQFEDAMRRLFKDNKIHIVDIGRKSKPSRTIVPVEK